ncbi:UNVERIFIED_CONTAM: hypothetical protein Slati_1483100 [Sesamum latifolium]|uniref:Transmembrane protein n=1 Tax=Sesamum latifolium TaxID=2727402 RepID=A0AAW2X8Z0_9LAMI
MLSSTLFRSFIFPHGGAAAETGPQAVPWGLPLQQPGPLGVRPCHVNKTTLRVGYVVSTVGSVFLMLALVNVAQIKLGCGGNGRGYRAVVHLLILLPLGFSSMFVLFSILLPVTNLYNNFFGK